MPNARFLVTGGAGFIASFVAPRLNPASNQFTLQWGAVTNAARSAMERIEYCLVAPRPTAILGRATASISVSRTRASWPEIGRAHV